VTVKRKKIKRRSRRKRMSKSIL